MSNHLVNISERQVKGRRMDRAFLLVLAVLVVLGTSSVAMAIDAASSPSVAAPVTYTV
jgi:hypothetical protein